jgi:large subunit ribosomal protein L15
MKGQQARAGGGPRPGFEGGQTPLIRRLPTKRGFRNPFRIEYAPVNLKALAALPAKSEVTPDSLRELGLISKGQHLKVLADGEIDKPLTVRAHRVSAAARAKIEAAGGTVEELTPRKEKKEPRKAKRAPARAEQPEQEAPAEATEEKPEAAEATEEDDSSSETDETGSAE